VTRVDADRDSLLAAFAVDAKARVAVLERALDGLDDLTDGARLSEAAAALGYEAHSLRGAAASVGHDRIEKLAIGLEHALARCDPADPATYRPAAAAARYLLGPLRKVLEGAPADTGPPPDAGRTSGPVVLHIEDNLSNLKLVEHVLEMRPEVTLVEARTGAAGLLLATKTSPVLVLLDLRLPDMPGDEVLRRLREDPATRELRVVVISAEARPTETDRLLAAGADEYLVKPIDLHALLEAVDTAVERGRE
jgi:CheY-like chemotaxis protein/HPt (histidine-containing phosphotransfer) domain-containing protein